MDETSEAKMKGNGAWRDTYGEEFTRWMTRRHATWHRTLWSLVTALIAFAPVPAGAGIPVQKAYYVIYIWGPPPYPRFPSEALACAYGVDTGWLVGPLKCQTNNWLYDIGVELGACPKDAHYNSASGDCDCNTGFKQLGSSCVLFPQTDFPKDGGPPEICSAQQPSGGNPIAFNVANKFEQHRDFEAGRLKFSLNYSALSSMPRTHSTPTKRNMALDERWRHEYERTILYYQGTTPESALVFRPGGRTISFGKTGSTWSADPEVVDRLVQVVDGAQITTGWKYYDAHNRSVENYSASGVLQSITFADGQALTLTYSDGTPGAGGGFVLDSNGNPTAQTLFMGMLLRVSDSFGRELTLGYDSSQRLVKLTQPDAGVHIYRYSGSNVLDSITFPDGLKRVYHHNESSHTGGASLPNALTGLSDEIAPGQIVRRSTYQYDSSGRATLTERAGSVAGFAVTTIVPDQQVSVVDPNGTARSYVFGATSGRVKLLSLGQPAGAGCGPSSSSLTYDANANVSSRTDFSNRKTCYANDLTRNLETARVEGLVSTDACPSDVGGYVPAAGTAQRKILTQWHADWRLESRRSEPKKITTSVYNGQPDPTAGGAVVTCAPATALVDGKPIAVLCKRVEQATSDETGASGFGATAVGTARVESWTYNEYGQVLTHDGPRTDVSDVTTYEYYADTQADWTKGDLKKVTNPLGQITEFTKYDRNGRLLRSVGANGVVTEHTYHPRGWLTQTKVTPVGGGTPQTTDYEYDGVGQLKKVTQADGSFVSYTYDAAHRLTRVEDSAGNKVEYTLDAMGNRTAENWKDAGGTLRKSLTRTIDALNRVQQVVGGMQ